MTNHLLKIKKIFFVSLCLIWGLGVYGVKGDPQRLLEAASVAALVNYFNQLSINAGVIHPRHATVVVEDGVVNEEIISENETNLDEGIQPSDENINEAFFAAVRASDSMKLMHLLQAGGNPNIINSEGVSLYEVAYRMYWDAKTSTDTSNYCLKMRLWNILSILLDEKQTRTVLSVDLGLKDANGYTIAHRGLINGWITNDWANDRRSNDWNLLLNGWGDGLWETINRNVHPLARILLLLCDMQRPDAEAVYGRHFNEFVDWVLNEEHFNMFMHRMLGWFNQAVVDDAGVDVDFRSVMLSRLIRELEYLSAMISEVNVEGRDQCLERIATAIHQLREINLPYLVLPYSVNVKSARKD